MALPERPISRGEDTPLPPDGPKSRIEQYLDYIAENGSGGTSNYNDLSNKPQINGVTLSGNKTTQELHIMASGAEVYDEAVDVIPCRYTYEVTDEPIEQEEATEQDYVNALREFGAEVEA